MAEIKDNDLEKAAGGMRPKEDKPKASPEGISVPRSQFTDGFALGGKDDIRALLIERLPIGTELDDSLLEKLVGGLARTFAPANLAESAKGLALEAKDLAFEAKDLTGDIAKKLTDPKGFALPDKFASLADMEKWFADKLSLRDKDLRR